MIRSSAQRIAGQCGKEFQPHTIPQNSVKQTQQQCVGSKLTEHVRADDHADALDRRGVVLVAHRVRQEDGAGAVAAAQVRQAGLLRGAGRGRLEGKEAHEDKEMV